MTPHERSRLRNRTGHEYKQALKVGAYSTSGEFTDPYGEVSTQLDDLTYLSLVVPTHGPAWAHLDSLRLLNSITLWRYESDP